VLHMDVRCIMNLAVIRLAPDSRLYV